MLVWGAAMALALHLVTDAVASVVGRRTGEAFSYLIFAAIAVIIAVNIEKTKLFVGD